MEIRTGPRLLRKRTLEPLMKAKFSQTRTKSLTPIVSHSQLAEITQRVVMTTHGMLLERGKEQGQAYAWETSPLA